jgi:hypothetical protein
MALPQECGDLHGAVKEAEDEDIVLGKRYCSGNGLFELLRPSLLHHTVSQLEASECAVRLANQQVDSGTVHTCVQCEDLPPFAEAIFIFAVQGLVGVQVSMIIKV